MCKIVLEDNCTVCSVDAMKMTTIQKQHINWLRSKFAVGSTERMTKINASLRIAAHYSKKR